MLCIVSERLIFDFLHRQHESAGPFEQHLRFFSISFFPKKQAGSHRALLKIDASRQWVETQCWTHSLPSEISLLPVVLAGSEMSQGEVPRGPRRPARPPILVRDISRRCGTMTNLIERDIWHVLITVHVDGAVADGLQEGARRVSNRGSTREPKGERSVIRHFDGPTSFDDDGHLATAAAADNGHH